MSKLMSRLKDWLNKVLGVETEDSRIEDSYK